ncbi:exodeoxyribonuclease VII large subunit [Candidatus Marinimicrobia bacterium]|nr:exodeoxyribonuclease VII large subunit [Candidatus Neomarinimicrobiota bacterium]
MERTLYSVSDLVSKTRALLELSFKNIYVEGEVSNVHYHSSGHLYFVIKDSLSELKCVMFKNANSILRFRVENGMRLISFGSLSMFEQRGQLQFVTKRIELSGIGALHQAFETLKIKLYNDGLFSNEHKLKIKKIPKKIGIITSTEGAALKDILHVLKRRSPFLEILIRPAKVQGENAAEDISNGVIELSNLGNIDAIIIGRGGGSIEDLWAFNEEALARVIFNCSVPIISAVGHETDFTISDFVSDVRAATPTEAAEIISLSKEELMAFILSFQEKLINYVNSYSNAKKNEVINILNRLMLLQPLNVIKSKQASLDAFYSFFVNHINELIELKKIRFLGTINQLQSIGPENVLRRGYSIAVNKKTKKIIRIASELSVNERFILKTSNGNLEAKKIK